MISNDIDTLTDIKHILDIAHDNGAEIRYLMTSMNTTSELWSPNTAKIIIVRDKDACTIEEFNHNCDNINIRLKEFGFHNAKYSDGYHNYPTFNTNILPNWLMPLYNKFPIPFEYVYDTYYRYTLTQEVSTFELTLEDKFKTHHSIALMIHKTFKNNNT